MLSRKQQPKRSKAVHNNKSTTTNTKTKPIHKPHKAYLSTKHVNTKPLRMTFTTTTNTTIPTLPKTLPTTAQQPTTSFQQQFSTSSFPTQGQPIPNRFSRTHQSSSSQQPTQIHAALQHLRHSSLFRASLPLLSNGKTDNNDSKKPKSDEETITTTTTATDPQPTPSLETDHPILRAYVTQHYVTKKALETQNLPPLGDSCSLNESNDVWDLAYKNNQLRFSSKTYPFSLFLTSVCVLANAYISFNYEIHPEQLVLFAASAGIQLWLFVVGTPIMTSTMTKIAVNKEHPHIYEITTNGFNGQPQAFRYDVTEPSEFGGKGLKIFAHRSWQHLETKRMFYLQNDTGAKKPVASKQ